MADAEKLYRRSIEQGGAPTVTFGNAIQVQYQLGMVDTAQTTLGRFTEDYPGHPGLLNYRLAFANANFDHAAARRLLDSLEVNPTGIPRVDVGLRFEQANVAAIEGRVSDTKRHLLAGYDAQAEAGLRFINEPRRLFEATIDAVVAVWYLEDPNRAVQALDAAMVATGYDTLPDEQRRDLQIGGIYARAGRVDRARQLIARHEQVEQPESDDDRSASLWAAHGTISLVEERFEDALRELEGARTAVTGCPLCFLPEIGEGLLGTGQVDSAIAVFESYLETPTLFRSQQDNFNLWAVLLGLGEAYRRADRIDDAVASYDRLLNQWADADPLLNPRIEDIRNRIAGMVEETRQSR